jgi:hypothetical protein
VPIISAGGYEDKTSALCSEQARVISHPSWSKC